MAVTAAEIQTAYAAVLRTELNATVAGAIAEQINNGSQSFTQYVDSLIDQAAASTVPAVAVLSLFEGNVPSSERVDSLAEFAQAQFASYTAMGVGNPALGPYEALGAALSKEAAFDATYGADAISSNSDFVNLVYVQVFGVTPSAAAAANLNGQIEYFVGIYTAAGIDADTALLTARGAVYGQVIGYAFQEGSPNSSLVSRVDNFFQAAATGDESVYEAPLPPASPNTGDTFTLTTGVDDFVGTSANDTFQGIVGGGFFNPSTLNTFDSIDGGAGTDTLNLIVKASELASDFTVKNVEIINLQQSDVALDEVDASVFGAEAQQIWQIGGATNVTELADGQTAGFRGLTDLNTSVGATKTATSINVALDGALVGDGEGSGSVDLSFTGAKVTTVSISGDIKFGGTAPTGAFGPDLNLDLGGAGGTKGVQTLNLAMSTATDLSIDGPGAADLVTFDASESTGGIRINLVSVPAGALSLESATFGSGADRVLFNNVASDADEVSFDFGAGNDEVFIGLQSTGEAAVSVALGAGKDVVTLQGGNVAIDDGELVGSVTFTDFASAQDSLLVAGFDGFTAQNLVDAAIADAETLADAVAALNTLLGGEATNITSFAKFEFGDNTYLYGDVSGAAAGAGDLLVGFVGSVDLNNNNVAQYLVG